MDWTTIAAALITAGLAALPGIVALRRDAVKVSAESERIEAEALKMRASIEADLRTELRGDILALRARIAEQEALIDELRAAVADMRRREQAHLAGIRRLIKQLTDHQLQPVWQPEDK